MCAQICLRVCVCRVCVCDGSITLRGYLVVVLLRAEAVQLLFIFAGFQLLLEGVFSFLLIKVCAESEVVLDSGGVPKAGEAVK